MIQHSIFVIWGYQTKCLLEIYHFKHFTTLSYNFNIRYFRYEFYIYWHLSLNQLHRIWYILTITINKRNKVAWNAEEWIIFVLLNLMFAYIGTLIFYTWHMSSSISISILWLIDRFSLIGCSNIMIHSYWLYI